MKRSKNHNKLVSGDKPHIFIGTAVLSNHYHISSVRNMMFSKNNCKSITKFINDKAC